VTDSDLEPISLDATNVEAVDDGEKHALPFWLELPLLILAALVIAVIIKTFFFQAFWIPSSSMEDTLQINDRVMVNKLAYRLGDLQRGHVIVFDDPRGGEAREETLFEAARRNVTEAIGVSVPRTEFIKRVIGLPGERVEIVEPGAHRRGSDRRAVSEDGIGDAGLWTDHRSAGRDVRHGRQSECEPGQPLLRNRTH